MFSRQANRITTSIATTKPLNNYGRKRPFSRQAPVARPGRTPASATGGAFAPSEETCEALFLSLLMCFVDFDFIPKADMVRGFKTSILKPHILKCHIPEHPRTSERLASGTASERANVPPDVAKACRSAR